MPDRTVYFNHKINGVYTNTTVPPKFRNADGTIALRRSDTLVAHEPPAADGTTSMDVVSTGKYSYTFEGLEDGAPYEYWLEYAYAGNTTRIERTFTAGGVSNPECYIFTFAELVDRFGLRNIAEASNKHSEDADPDYDAVQQAMDYACDQIHAALPLYAAPLDVVTPNVKEWAMVICMENLFNARGDTDKNTNIYRRMCDNVYKEMTLYGTPLRELTATKKTHTFVPDQE